MKYAKIMLMAGVASLFSTAVMAASANSIRSLPNNDKVTLNGTVEDFNSEHSFRLHDSSGSVTVDLSSAKSVVLKDGEKVTVDGTVRQTILGSDVVAGNVSEDKGLGARVGEAIDSATGQDAAASAQPVTIAALPDAGLVKVDGIVDGVSSEKKFTLKDSTGHVDVTIKSGESASLNKDTEVTVIGYVDKGVLGKTISATEVDVRSTSAPMAKK